MVGLLGAFGVQRAYQAVVGCVGALLAGLDGGIFTAIAEIAGIDQRSLGEGNFLVFIGRRAYTVIAPPPRTNAIIKAITKSR